MKQYYIDGKLTYVNSYEYLGKIILHLITQNKNISIDLTGIILISVDLLFIFCRGKKSQLCCVANVLLDSNKYWN